MKVVLSGGRVVDPSQGIDQEADLVLEQSVVAAIEPPGSVRDGEVIDVGGAVVAPGFIDLHVHLREPGFEYKEDVESGTRAAAAGGFTAVCCMPNTSPAIDTAAVVRHVVDRARAVGSCRVYPVAALTRGLAGDQLAEIGELKAAGACAISDDAFPIQNSETVRRGMEYCAQFGMVLMVHSEDKALTSGGVMNEGATSALLGLPGIPAVSEDIAVSRNVLLSRLTGCRLHLLHMSTGASVGILRAAKAAGVPVTGETAPHYWVLTDEACEGYNTNAKMNPPLRTAADGQALVAGLADGVIDAIATDHAPHAFHEKDVEFDRAPFGILGLETAFGLTYTHLVLRGFLTLSQAVDRLSCGPARVLGLPGGTLAPGSPADVSVLDLGERWTVDRGSLRSKSANTPFDGHVLQGRAKIVFVGGRKVTG